jgi:putative ABC transport system permease protein
MNTLWLALRMLTGDASKYRGLIFSVAFACMLMSHQSSIFWGLMRRTTSQIMDVRESDLWVMDPHATHLDDIRPLSDGAVAQVRNVPGVSWAVPLYKGAARMQDVGGRYRQTFLIGVDDASLVGGPRKMLLGKSEALREPNAILIDKAGYEAIWPKEPLSLGRTIEINGRRAVVAGICDSSAPFITMPVMYARLSEVRRVFEKGRLTSFVLVRASSGTKLSALAADIERRTGLAAYSSEDFAAKTISYYLRNTGIPVNFGMTVLLAFLVGAAVTGQTFYLFTIENIKQLGCFRAMGVSDRRIVLMILSQAVVVGVLGYALGIGLAATMFKAGGSATHLRGFGLLWPSIIGSALAVLLIVVGTALVAVRRVLSVEPAAVFRT